MVDLHSKEFVAYVEAKHEAMLLKRFLAEKLRSYSGITREELENICTTFGVSREDDSE